MRKMSIPNREISAVYKSEIMTQGRSFYHGLILGLIALMDNQYKIKSNRESREGRYDISLIPRGKNIQELS